MRNEYDALAGMMVATFLAAILENYGTINNATEWNTEIQNFHFLALTASVPAPDSSVSWFSSESLGFYSSKSPFLGTIL